MSKSKFIENGHLGTVLGIAAFGSFIYMAYNIDKAQHSTTDKKKLAVKKAVISGSLAVALIAVPFFMLSKEEPK